MTSIIIIGDTKGSVRLQGTTRTCNACSKAMNLIIDNTIGKNLGIRWWCECGESQAINIVFGSIN